MGFFNSDGVTNLWQVENTLKYHDKQEVVDLAIEILNNARKGDLPTLIREFIKEPSIVIKICENIDELTIDMDWFVLKDCQYKQHILL